MQRWIVRALAGTLLISIIVFLVNYRVGLVGGTSGYGLSIAPRGAAAQSAETAAPGVDCVVDLFDTGSVHLRLHCDEGGLYFALRRPAPRVNTPADSDSPLTIFDGDWFKVSFETLVDRRRALALLVFYVGEEFLADPAEESEIPEDPILLDAD